MSHLSEWSEVISRQGSIEREKQYALEAAMEAGMPKAIAKLPEHSNEDLMHLYDQFSGSAYWPRETQLRQQFRDAVKVEILSRMTPRSGEPRV